MKTKIGLGMACLAAVLRTCAAEQGARFTYAFHAAAQASLMLRSLPPGPCAPRWTRLGGAACWAC